MADAFEDEVVTVPVASSGRDPRNDEMRRTPFSGARRISEQRGDGHSPARPPSMCPKERPSPR